MADLSSMSVDELIGQLKAAKSSAPAASKSLSDMSTDELINELRKSKPAPEMTAGRAAGLTARAVGKGAGDAVLGIPALALDVGHNIGVAADKYLLGDPYKREFGLPYSSGLQYGLNTVADAVGLPKPETAGERIASTTAETAFSVLNPVKLAKKAITTAPRVIPKVIEFAKEIKNGIKSAPTVAGGVTGGVGSTLNEYNPDHPYLNFALGLLAGPGAMLAGKYGRNVFRRDLTSDEAINIAENNTLSQRFGVPLTRDQITGVEKDRTLADQLRYGGKGPIAEQIVKNFDQQQREALNSAQERLIQNISGSSMPRNASEIGASLQENFRSAKGQAKQESSRLYSQSSDPQALADAGIPFELDMGQVGRISSNVRQSLVNRPTQERVYVTRQNTPIAAQALDALANFSRGRLPSMEYSPTPLRRGDNLVSINWEGVDVFRKHLNDLKMSTARETPDRRAMNEIIKLFDDQIGSIGGNSLLDTARSNYRDYARTFKGDVTTPSNTKTAINKLTDTNISGTEAFNKIFNQSFKKGEAQHLVDTLRRAYANNPQGMSALKEGGLQKIFTNANGEMLSENMIAKNINNAVNGAQRDLYSALYSPQELRNLQDYGTLIGKIGFSKTAKNPSKTNYPLSKLLNKFSGAAVGGYLGEGVGHAVGGPWGGTLGAGLGAAAGSSVDDIMAAAKARAITQGQLPQYKQPIPVQSLLQGGLQAAQPFFGSITGGDMRRLGLLGQ